MLTNNITVNTVDEYIEKKLEKENAISLPITRKIIDKLYAVVITSSFDSPV